MSYTTCQGPPPSIAYTTCQATPLRVPPLLLSLCPTPLVRVPPPANWGPAVLLVFNLTIIQEVAFTGHWIDLLTVTLSTVDHTLVVTVIVRGCIDKVEQVDIPGGFLLRSLSHSLVKRYEKTALRCFGLKIIRSLVEVQGLNYGHVYHVYCGRLSTF